MRNTTKDWSKFDTLQKQKESLLSNVMPPIISVKNKVITPSNFKPIRVSYENFNEFDVKRKANTSMYLSMPKHL